MSNKYPLLLLHGALGSKNQFERIQNILNIGKEVYSINFRGHGGEKYKGPFLMEKFVEDVDLFLQKNQLQKVHIFGYSMGGYVAICFAEKYPDRVGKIMTLATKFNWTPESSQREVLMLNAEKIEVKVPSFAEELKQRFFPADWKSALRKTADMMIALGSQPPLGEKNYKNINTDTLISVGSHDNIVSIEESKQVAGLLSNGSFKIFEGWKHPIEGVEPGQLTKEIIDYFG